MHRKKRYCVSYAPVHRCIVLPLIFSIVKCSCTINIGCSMVGSSIYMKLVKHTCLIIRCHVTGMFIYLPVFSDVITHYCCVKELLYVCDQVSDVPGGVAIISGGFSRLVSTYFSIKRQYPGSG